MSGRAARCEFCGELAGGPDRFICMDEGRPILFYGRQICNQCENLSSTRLERLRLARWQSSLRAVQRQGPFRTIFDVSGLRIGQFLHPLMSDRMLTLFFPGEERRILPDL